MALKDMPNWSAEWMKFRTLGYYRNLGFRVSTGSESDVPVRI